MIISCPQCDTRFVVPSTVFRNGPRKLRCASCKHKWEQDKPEDAEDLSKFVSKNQDKEKSEKADKEGNLVNKVKKDFTQGYFVILAAFAFILFGFVGYKMLFSQSITMGQGLAFNNVEIIREDKSVTVSGEIVNAMNDVRGVPPIEIVMMLANDIKGDSVVITPEKEILQAGENIIFSTNLDNIGEEVLNLYVGFKTPEKPKEEKADKTDNSSDAVKED